jgi:hypothetical protein
VDLTHHRIVRPALFGSVCIRSKFAGWYVFEFLQPDQTENIETCPAVPNAALSPFSPPFPEIASSENSIDNLVLVCWRLALR